MQAGVTSLCLGLLVLLCMGTQSGCLELQDLKLIDDTIIVTEIRRIMPNNGELSANNSYTQVIVEGAADVEENLIWDLILSEFNSTGQPIFSTNDSVKANDKFTLTFPMPFIDVKILLLIAKNGTEIENYHAIWYDIVNITDKEARVAVVGDDATGNAFLRVSTGKLGDPVVAGPKTCLPDDSPCYFQLKDFPDGLPKIERCYDAQTSKNHTIKYCDETVYEFIGLPDPPGIFLLDDTKLNLNYNLNPNSVEVLLVNSSTSDHLNTDINCVAQNDNECSLEIAETIDTVNIMVVMFDENGYVVGSDTYPFENYGVKWLGLSSDVLMASWKSNEKSEFIVKLLSDSNPESEPVFQSVLNCGGETGSCEVFFADPDFASVKATTVHKQNDSNSVGSTKMQGTTQTPCSVTTIITTDDKKENITFEVTSTIGIPSSAIIVEIVSDPDNEMVSNNKCNGKISALSPLNYTVGCSLTNSTLEGDKKFILVSFNETNDGKIQEVGTVYTTLNDFNINVHRVGNAAVNVSALWLTNPDGGSFSMNGITCEADKPCYLLDFPTARETVSVCTQINNGAEPLNQCVFKILEDADDISLSKFQLKDRKDIVITAPFVSDNVHIILYQEINSKSEAVCTPPPGVENRVCNSSITLPSDSQTAPLKALLVGTNIGVVKESTAIEVEDLKFTYTSLYENTLTVEWTALNPEGYTATLEAISLKDDREVVPSDVECSSNSCAAFYRDLNPSSAYTLSVHKIGQEISETSEVIEMGSITVDEKPEMTVTSVKKRTATSTEINLVTGASLNLATKVDVLVAMPGVQFLSTAVYDGQNSNGISFNHNIPIFDGVKMTSFILFYYDASGTFTKKGRAYLELHDLDSKLAWVATAKDTSKDIRSLRVDAGSQDMVDIGAKKCYKKDSPCYFLEDETLPPIVERCVQVENTADNNMVEQCDTEITTSGDLTDTKISLSGNNIEVSVNLQNSNDILEVKIYDTVNASAIFSVGNLTCDPTINGSSTACMQPLRTPTDQKNAKVLVVEMNPVGVVLRSSVTDIAFPATGVESWVIAVSVLASVMGAAIIVYAVVVVIKKNKSRKAVKKELGIISGDDLSRSIALDDLDDDRYSRIEQNPYRTKYPAPPVPRKPTRRDSVPSYGNPYGPSYDNPAFARGDRFGDAPVALPRIQPRLQAGPGRNGYY